MKFLSLIELREVPSPFTVICAPMYNAIDNNNVLLLLSYCCNVIYSVQPLQRLFILDIYTFLPNLVSNSAVGVYYVIK